MLIERQGPNWKLTPLGLQQLQRMPKAARITSADPLALLERMVPKQQAPREHRESPRGPQTSGPSNGTIPRSRRA